MSVAERAIVLPTPPLPLTPALTEGPYYPPRKPDDRDADLTVVDGADGPAAGQVLDVRGLLVHTDGSPIADATVEIWQVDNQGIYLHPNDPRTRQRDVNFQSYGESVTTADGSWRFRTIFPALYEGRPRHIHLKVRVGGKAVLTSQFFFTGDDRLASDGIARAVGADALARITLEPTATTDATGRAILTADEVLVVNA